MPSPAVGIPDFGYRDCIRLARLTEPDSGAAFGPHSPLSCRTGLTSPEVDVPLSLVCARTPSGFLVGDRLVVTVQVTGRP